MTGEEAKKILRKLLAEDEDIDFFSYDEKEAIDHFAYLPENKGEWIEKEMFDGDVAYECSKCGELFCLIDGTPADNLYNFCPNCGADLRGGNE